MDQNADRSIATSSSAVGASNRLWIVVAVSVTTLCILMLTGDARPARAIPAGMLIVAVACYLVYRARRSTGMPSRSASSLTEPDRDLTTDVIAALPDPTVLLDADGRVIMLNEPATAMAPALRRGEPAFLAFRIPDLLDAIRKTSVSRKPERLEFAEHVPSERWYEAFVIPIPMNGAAPQRSGTRVLLTFHDLTAVRRVEEMRVDFVANASHELRTPLAALSGFIETLKGSARNDVAARERFLDIMEAQAKRMARLIDDLLSLSRIELAAHLRPETSVELLPIVRQVIDALQTLARDRGVKVTVDAPKEPLVVSGDHDELTRVFENLIENALKYGATGARVDIALSRTSSAGGGEEAMVAVRDYGPGISAEHLPRLTERFYRVDVAESREQGGTGLGLALVKHIMNRHRGRITIESRSGEGATFTVRLPLSTGHPVGPKINR